MGDHKGSYARINSRFEGHPLHGFQLFEGSIDFGQGLVAVALRIAVSGKMLSTSQDALLL